MLEQLAKIILPKEILDYFFFSRGATFATFAPLPPLRGASEAFAEGKSRGCHVWMGDLLF